MGETRLLKRCLKVDPTYYLTNQGTGYTSLWLLSETAPADPDSTSQVTFPKGSTGYMKIIPGTSNTTILSALPTTFDKYGWRTQSTLDGSFVAGNWTFYITLVTGKYVTGNLTVWARLWKSANPDGSAATALTDWLQIVTLTAPAANTTYNLSGTVSLAQLNLANEYLFVEYALQTTSACGAATGCVVSFMVNGGANQSIVTTAFTPTVVVGWLEGWNYRKSHVINPASGAGTNYQIRIKAHYGSGTDSGGDVYLNSHSRTDFGDVRFTDNDGVTLLDYWMEEKVDGDYAIFWVEVADDLSTNPAIIYIYYGNPNVTTTSNGDATFLLFDDFLGTSLDTSKWTVHKGTAGTNIFVENGYLRTYNLDGASVRSLQSFGRNIKLVVRAKMDTTAQYQATYDWFCASSDLDIAAGARVGSGYANGILSNYYTVSETMQRLYSGTVTALFNGILKVDTTVWHKFRVHVGPSTMYQFLDDQADGSGSDTTLSSGYVILWQYGATGSRYWDWIFVAKFVDPEPSHGSWGSEETPAGWRALQHLTEPPTAGWNKLKYAVEPPVAGAWNKLLYQGE